MGPTLGATLRPAKKTPNRRVAARSGGTYRCRAVFWGLVVLFTVVPIVELYLVLLLGSLLGLWPTLAIMVVTAFLGSYLSKREGLRVWRDYQRALTEMRMPEEGIISGVLVLVGGVLLITPGVLTDLTGLLLMVPPIRRVVAAFIEKRLRASFESGSSETFFAQTVVGPDGAVRRHVRVRTSAPRSTPPPPVAPTEPTEALEGDVVDARGRVLRPVDPTR